MSIQPISNDMASGDARVIFVGWNATGDQICSQIRDLWNLNPNDAIASNAIKHNDVSGDPFFSLCVSLIGSGEHPLESTICDLGCTQINGGQVTQQYHVIAGYIPGGCLLVRHNEKNIPFDKGWKEDHRLQHTMWQMPETVPLATPTAFNYWDRFNYMANIIRRHKTLNTDLERRLEDATQQKAKADEAFRTATERATQDLDVDLLRYFFSEEDADNALKRQFAELKEREELAELSELQREHYNTLSRNANMYSRFVQDHKNNLAAKDQEVKKLQETLAATEVERSSENEFADVRIRDLEHKNRLLLRELQRYESSSQLPGAGKAGEKSGRRDDETRPGFSGKKQRGT